MEKTWKPTTAGIVNIITGALSALTAIGIIIGIIAIGNINIMRFLPPADAPFIAPLIGTILIVILVLSIIEAVFPIVGGVFALQRRKWGWAGNDKKAAYRQRRGTVVRYGPGKGEYLARFDDGHEEHVNTKWLDRLENE